MTGAPIADSASVRKTSAMDTRRHVGNHGHLSYDEQREVPVKYFAEATPVSRVFGKQRKAVLVFVGRSLNVPRVATFPDCDLINGMFDDYPKKRIYAANDPFFNEGNIAFRAYWLQKEARSEDELAIINEEATAIVREVSQPIYCQMPLCISMWGHELMFPSVAAYELHYESVHRNVCSQCQKIFPNAHFLRLHLDEIHDVLKQIQKERGEKIYACYVPSCNKVFSVPKMRRLHLVDKHKYPKFYPFDIVFTGSISVAERRSRQRKAGRSRLRKPTHPPTTEMDVDDLTSHISRIKLIPSSVSFGRSGLGFSRTAASKRSTSSAHSNRTSTQDMDEA